MHSVPSQTIRVLIADDHPVMRLGLDHLIRAQAGMEVAGLVGSGAEVLAELAEAAPEVIILDVDMPGMEGLALVHELHAQARAPKIIIFTAYHDEKIFNDAISAGVHGFISKENVFDNLVEGIRSVVTGKNYFSPVFSGYLLKRIQSGDETNSRFREKENVEHQLTSTEKRIIRFVAEGKTSHQIAEQLFVSVKTVENHRTNICKKLGLHGKNSLLKFALEHKYLWEDSK
jgi:DNA-binding NarL/FixJ family response regulator